MNIIDYIGIFGSLLVGFSFIPQTYKTLKTKKTKDISKLFIIANIISSTCMLIFGVKRKVLPIIIANGSVFLNAIILFYCVIFYSNDKMAVESNSEPKLEGSI